MERKFGYSVARFVGSGLPEQATPGSRVPLLTKRATERGRKLRTLSTKDQQIAIARKLRKQTAAPFEDGAPSCLRNLLVIGNLQCKLV